MRGKSSASPDPQVAEFLRLEFDVLHRRIELLERKRADRITAFLAVYGLVAGAGLLFIDPASSTAGRTSLLLVLGLATFIGVGVLRQSTLAAIQVVLLYRRAGRVRVYFSRLQPSAEPFLPWAPGDDTPPFRDSRAYSTFDGTDTLVIVLNGFASAVFGGVVSLALSTGVLWAAASGAGLFLVALIVQVLWIRRAVVSADREATRPYNVHFPRDAESTPDGHW